MNAVIFALISTNFEIENKSTARLAACRVSISVKPSVFKIKCDLQAQRKCHHHNQIFFNNHTVKSPILYVRYIIAWEALVNYIYHCIKSNTTYACPLTPGLRFPVPLNSVMSQPRTRRNYTLSQAVCWKSDFLGIVSSSIPAVPASSPGFTYLQYPHCASGLHYRSVILSSSRCFTSISYAFHLSFTI